MPQQSKQKQTNSTLLSSSSSAAAAASSSSSPSSPNPNSSSFNLRFFSNLFDEVARGAPTRPIREMLQPPQFPIIASYQYRIQVNLLYFVRNYLNLFLICGIVTCVFLPYLTIALGLAGALHVQKITTSSSSSSSSSDNNNNNNTNSKKVVKDDSKIEKNNINNNNNNSSRGFFRLSRILKTLQFGCVCFLFYIYGVLVLLLWCSVPFLLVVVHATFTPYHDKSSKELEDYLARIDAKATTRSISSNKNKNGNNDKKGSNDNNGEKTNGVSSKNNNGNRNKLDASGINNGSRSKIAAQRNADSNLFLNAASLSKSGSSSSKKKHKKSSSSPSSSTASTSTTATPRSGMLLSQTSISKGKKSNNKNKDNNNNNNTNASHQLPDLMQVRFPDGKNQDEIVDEDAEQLRRHHKKTLSSLSAATDGTTASVSSIASLKSPVVGSSNHPHPSTSLKNSKSSANTVRPSTPVRRWKPANSLSPKKSSNLRSNKNNNYRSSSGSSLSSSS